ncbi:oxidoreductase [Tersicoccus solisilvae]|uniref:Oxidoreductase n=1 Tax=Tersicoccus solisilvae TaxID=1882339 RepID=A0ABQ1PHS5_9MICC|nr:SDR family NAD(P)-dependent oxidoreductase [Tersicoccus solisilvae]GGC97417.1 oxidoreductase [Tersicoccus solisilvae]
MARYPDGARALVTGGTGGIGAACARRLRAEGVDVVTADLHPDADIRCDITDEAAVAALAAHVGRVDVLVNSAGIQGLERPLTATTLVDWQRVFRVNVDGTFLLCRAVVPGMTARGWGRIINLASIAGKEGNARQSAYSASKAAVIGLTKALAKELAETGVLVHAVAPAIIRTPLNAETDPDTFARLLDKIPMRRAGEPDELAALVAWLASAECTFTTGAVHDLSGGRATY